MPRIKSLPAGTALAVDLLSAYLANNTVAVKDVPDLIRSTRMALAGAPASVLGGGDAATFTPAVSVRKSLASSAHILSLIDGKPYRTLRRHLAAHGLTPESYRARYNLPTDYPMVAPDYAAQRRALAQQSGLGRRAPAQTSPNEAGEAVVAPAAVEPATAAVGSPEAAPVQATQPAQESATSSKVKAKKPRSKPDEGRVSESKSSTGEGARPRVKLSLFPKRSVEPEVQSDQDTTSGTDLKSSSLPTKPAVVLDPQAAATPAPVRPHARDEQDSVVTGTSPRLTLMEAIARKRAVAALYNGTTIKLAPHQIFERHGDLFLSALNLSKNWRADEERRLGQFKFAGLKDVKLLEDTIVALPSYNGALPRSDDVLILSI